MDAMPWPFGPYPPGGLEELGPHVIAYYAGGFPASNSAIVRGTEGALVFDPNCFRFAEELRAAADEIGIRPGVTVLSHAHDDHTMGTERFSPPARVLSRSKARERLQRNLSEGRRPGAQYERGYPGAAREAEGVRIVVPGETVERPTVLDLGGGVTVRLQPEELAHTDGDLWALVEPDGVALCGDLWYARCEPYVGSG
ncbi:MAG TPA: MBL fold metallo-hydrolase, partial [Actinomycetota bacterium]|nr:MBL fold metallo-hydrolase [Actinomycetota bacterium]